MDTKSIQGGADWRSSIRAALDSAEVLLVIIGPEWLRVSDERGLRRIDQEDDWVRNEIKEALAQEKVIIPVLVDEGQIPPADKLPRPISKLVDNQVIPIRPADWDDDINFLLSSLEFHLEIPFAQREFGSYPVAAESLVPVGDERLAFLLKEDLSQWRKVVSTSPENPDVVRTELCREYEFATFSDTIRFMRQLETAIKIANHHPRWENIYTTLRVHLLTWDIGNCISERDIQLAKYFEKAYSNFTRREPT
jgi:pterin-4a-carbinolamine dehydratase